MTSSYVLEYIRQNPIDLMNEDKGLMKEKRTTPDLVIPKFYHLLESTGTLFTQQEYMKYLIHVWPKWYGSLTNREKLAFKVRVYRGFYLGGIDQIFVQGLLNETSLFASVGYDHSLETTGIDLIATTLLGNRIAIALRVGTWASCKADERRQQRIGQTDTITIVKDLNNPKVGGMVFYKIEDLKTIIQTGQDDLETYTVFWKTA